MTSLRKVPNSSKRMRGKSVVWDHFNFNEDEGQGSSPTGGKTRPAAYCRYCNLKYGFPNATKMMRHLLKCSFCPEETKRELEQSGFGRDYRAEQQQSSASSSCVEEDLCMLSSPSMVRARLSPIYQANGSPTPGTSALSPRASLLMVGNPLARVNRNELQEHGNLGPNRYEGVSNDRNRYEVDNHDTDRLEPANRVTRRYEAANQDEVIELEPDNQNINKSQDSSEVVQTDRLLARAILRTDVPVSIIENAYWHELFRHLTPAYALPSKDSLVGTLLDAEFAEVFDAVSAQLNKTKHVALLVYGHPNIATKHPPVSQGINLVVTTPKPIVIDCMNSSDLQNPDQIAEVIAETFQKVEPAQILVVLTDLKKTFRDSWPILSTRFPNTTFAGNPIEGLSNILRCLMAQGSVRDMCTQASQVCAYKNSLIDQGCPQFLNQSKGCFPLSQEEYYKTDLMKLLESLLDCRIKMQEVANGQNTTAELKDIILDQGFWDTLSLVVSLWHHFNSAQSKLEQNDTRLSDVATELQKINGVVHDAVNHSPLSSNERSAVLTELVANKEACCKGIHYAACLLDPRYCGRDLSDNDIACAIEYIVEFTKRSGVETGRVIANLAEYRARDGNLWSKQYVWDAPSHVAPATWWRGICDSQPLSPIAVDLLSISASSSLSSFTANVREDTLTRDQIQRLDFVRANSELTQQDNTGPNMIVLPTGY